MGKMGRCGHISAMGREEVRGTSLKFRRWKSGRREDRCKHISAMGREEEGRTGVGTFRRWEESRYGGTSLGKFGRTEGTYHMEGVAIFGREECRYGTTDICRGAEEMRTLARSVLWGAGYKTSTGEM